MQLDFAECDRARVAHDPSYDGRFFTGVRTTGVHCRPVCPVRHALSKNVCYFPSAAAAELRPALTRTFPGVAFAVARIIGAPALRRWAF